MGDGIAHGPWVMKMEMDTEHGDGHGDGVV